MERSAAATLPSATKLYELSDPPRRVSWEQWLGQPARGRGSPAQKPARRWFFLGEGQARAPDPNRMKSPRAGSKAALRPCLFREERTALLVLRKVDRTPTRLLLGVAPPGIAPPRQRQARDRFPQRTSEQQQDRTTDGPGWTRQWAHQSPKVRQALGPGAAPESPLTAP